MACGKLSPFSFFSLRSIFSHALFLVLSRFVLDLLQGDIGETKGYLRRLFRAGFMEAHGGHSLERNLGCIVDSFAVTILLSSADTSCFELSPLLQRSQAACFLKLLLPCLPLRLFTSSVCQPRSRLREHFLLIFVHQWHRHVLALSRDEGRSHLASSA